MHPSNLRRRAAICALLLASTLARGATSVSITDLHWLSGCWASDGGEPGSGEQWMSPAGGTMLGISRSVRDGRTVAWEFLRIVETEHEGLLYIAAPSGQSTTAFLMTSIADDAVVFSNPDHDFPQRVIYRRLAGDRLLGRIEGDLGGRLRAVDFPMTRTQCAATG